MRSGAIVTAMILAATLAASGEYAPASPNRGTRRAARADHGAGQSHGTCDFLGKDGRFPGAGGLGKGAVHCQRPVVHARADYGELLRQLRRSLEMVRLAVVPSHSQATDQSGAIDSRNERRRCLHGAPPLHSCLNCDIDRSCGPQQAFVASPAALDHALNPATWECLYDRPCRHGALLHLCGRASRCVHHLRRHFVHHLSDAATFCLSAASTSPSSCYFGTFSSIQQFQSTPSSSMPGTPASEAASHPRIGLRRTRSFHGIPDADDEAGLSSRSIMPPHSTQLLWASATREDPRHEEAVDGVKAQRSSSVEGRFSRYKRINTEGGDGPAHSLIQTDMYSNIQF